MLETQSERRLALIQIRLTAISVALTTIFFLIIILGIARVGTDLFFDDILQMVFVAFAGPFISSFLIVSSGYESLFMGGQYPIAFTIASVIGVIGYILNIGILINSINGRRVNRSRQISDRGYLMGIIGSAISLTVIVNTKTFWLAGYILMILSLIFTIKTRKQMLASQATDGEDQPQKMQTMTSIYQGMGQTQLPTSQQSPIEVSQDEVQNSSLESPQTNVTDDFQANPQAETNANDKNKEAENVHRSSLTQPEEKKD